MTDQELERIVLEIISIGRHCCGSGFGKYPLGIKDAVDELMPKCSTSEPVRAAYADFIGRLNL